MESEPRHPWVRCRVRIPLRVKWLFFSRYFYKRSPVLTDRGRILELVSSTSGGETRLLPLTTHQNLTSLWGGSQLATTKHVDIFSAKIGIRSTQTSISYILSSTSTKFQQGILPKSKSSPLSLGGVLEWRPSMPPKRCLSTTNISLVHSCVPALSFEAFLQVMGHEI